MNRVKLSLFVAAVLTLCVLLMAACGQTAPTPTPTVPPGPPRPATATPARAPTRVGPPATATTAAPADATWQRIKQNGKLIAGTSADYPPFEFLNGKFQIDGFDPALIRAIGKQLGVQVEVKNYAFDGLYNALHLGQVDVVIAAVSITPEREKVMDFTNTYYVSEDATLANDKAPIAAVTALEQLANYRIGVQDATVYETFIQDKLVDTGKMPQRNLLSFTDIGQAISSLRQGTVDVVMLDAGPAQAFVNEGGVKQVAGGLFPQLYGIALPLDAPALRENLNKALALLQADGTVVNLQMQYLGSKPNPQVPTPTPRPTNTPRPVVISTPTPAGCIDGMAYVADLNYDDQNMTNPAIFQPGQPFRKGWRVKNTGTCTWSTAYKLVFAYGNTPAASMGGQPVAVMQDVPPGGTAEFYVNLIAPIQPGVYQGFWQMVTGKNVSFGENVYVGIGVPAPVTATPAPTQTPVAGITFTVDRANIKAGECATLSWNVQNVRAVYFYPDGADWTKYGVAGQANSIQCPGQTTTFDLRVVQLDNSTEVRQIILYVTQSSAPVIAFFAVNPSQIAPGQQINLQWDVQGAISKVTIVRGGQFGGAVIWDGAPTRGNMSDFPPGTGTMPYVIEATGPGGVARQQRDVRILAQPTVQAPTATPQVPPTPAPAPPVIEHFSVQPERIESGQCVNIQWSLGGGGQYIHLTRNGVPVLDRGGPNGQLQDCLTEPINYLFRLEAFNHTGMMVAQDRNVTVHTPPLPK